MKNMEQIIRITVGDTHATAKLKDTKLAAKIMDLLPIKAAVSRWGDEIYFEIPLIHRMEDATTQVEVGDLAYWEPGRCFCIFYGKTPISTGDKPVPASDVEVFGKLESSFEDLKREKALQATVEAV